MSGRLKKPPRRCWFCKIRNPRQLFEGKNNVHICDRCVALFHDLRVVAPGASPHRGMCPDGRHGLDYPGQDCDLCKMAACPHDFIEPKAPLGFVCTTCKAIVRAPERKPATRRTVGKAFKEGATRREIAEEVGESVDWVEARIRRALGGPRAKFKSSHSKRRKA